MYALASGQHTNAGQSIAQNGWHSLPSEGNRTVAPGARIATLLGYSTSACRIVKQGDHLFRAGSPFHYFYVVHEGFFKTCGVTEGGCEQTAGFHLRGDILGLDAVATGTYAYDAVALADCGVQAIPYHAVVAQGLRNPALLHELHLAFSEEIRNIVALNLNRSRHSAEERVATFLLQLSARFSARGFSATVLQLQLTRQEIGGLLGMQLETISRALSRFAKKGLITVRMREIVLLHPAGLRTIIEQADGS